MAVCYTTFSSYIRFNSFSAMNSMFIHLHWKHFAIHWLTVKVPLSELNREKKVETCKWNINDLKRTNGLNECYAHHSMHFKICFVLFFWLLVKLSHWKKKEQTKNPAVLMVSWTGILWALCLKQMQNWIFFFVVPTKEPNWLKSRKMQLYVYKNKCFQAKTPSL